MERTRHGKMQVFKRATVTRSRNLRASRLSVTNPAERAVLAGARLQVAFCRTSSCATAPSNQSTLSLQYCINAVGGCLKVWILVHLVGYWGVGVELGAQKCFFFLLYKGGPTKRKIGNHCSRKM